MTRNVRSVKLDLTERRRMVLDAIKVSKKGIVVNQLYRKLKKKIAKGTLTKEITALQSFGLINYELVGNSKRLFYVKKKRKINLKSKTKMESQRAWKEYHELKKEQELKYEVDIAYITNHAFPIGALFNSDVDVTLEISNPTDRRIGISRILIESKNPVYPITIQSIPPFVLEPQDTRILKLIQKGNVAADAEKKYIEANIQIFNANRELIKVIPIQLFINTHYDLKQSFE